MSGATTIAPSLRSMSAKEVVMASTAMISDATVMSKPVSRVYPFSVGFCPTVILRRNLSFMSTTRRHEIFSRSMSRRANAARPAVSWSGSVLSMPSFRSPLSMDAAKTRVSVLLPRAEAIVQRLVLLGELVEHPRVDGGGEVVRGADGVDVAGEVEVHLLHRDDLRVSTARGAALDAEGGAHRGLADARDAVLLEVRAHGLRQADGGGGLAARRAAWGLMPATTT